MASKTTVSDIKKARVTIELGPEDDRVEYTLIPSPSAIVNLSQRYDGLAPLMAALSRLNIQAMADVIVAGLGLEGREARDMPARVFETGTIDLLKPLSDFASILANGGRPLKTEKESDGEGGSRPL